MLAKNFLFLLKLFEVLFFYFYFFVCGKRKGKKDEDEKWPRVEILNSVVWVKLIKKVSPAGRFQGGEGGNYLVSDVPSRRNSQCSENVGKVMLYTSVSRFRARSTGESWGWERKW